MDEKIEVTHDQIAHLAFLLYEATGNSDADRNWFHAERLLESGEISAEDPDPMTTLREAEDPLQE